MTQLRLYGYWRSSAAYRVRIALNLKNLDYQDCPVNLMKEGGEQHKADFHRLNPSELVPVLIDGDVTLSQSLTIIDYLDDQYPETRLVPGTGSRKYQVLSLAQDIAMDIHPLNNLRVLQYLSQTLAVDDAQKAQWYRHWIGTGFTALEEKLTSVSGTYCVGESISLADVCLVPQVYNAERFCLDMTAYPQICRITQSLRALPAFSKAAPENQPDAPSSAVIPTDLNAPPAGRYRTTDGSD